MQLQYFRGNKPNFGDELNTWLWPKLLPGLLDDDSSVLFLGIGSILGDQYDVKAKKVVFGTGFVPSYNNVPNVHTGDWDIFFVRGPRTARELGIPEELGIGDSALLIRAVDLIRPKEASDIGFMPHWESLPRGNWEKSCVLAGTRLIDPTKPVNEVLGDLLGCKLLVTEAMHGAIVADALRVPWVPVLPLDGVHRQKWFDWAEALGISLDSHRLWPSSIEEAKLTLVRRRHLHRLASVLSLPAVSGLSTTALTHLAAHRLDRMTRRPPCLSHDDTVDRATNQMLDKLMQLKAAYMV